MNVFGTFGSLIRGQRINCGPSLGWVDAPVLPDIVVTGDHAVQPYESILLLNLSAPTTITLPDLAAWLSRSGPDGPIYVKDIGGNLSTNNVTIAPVGGKTIDGQPSAKMAADYASTIIRPRSDCSGWYLT